MIEIYGNWENLLKAHILFVVPSNSYRFVWSTLLSFCTVNCLSSAVHLMKFITMERINFRKKYIFVDAKNWAQGSWVRSANATSVPCPPSPASFFLLGSNQKFDALVHWATALSSTSSTHVCSFAGTGSEWPWCSSSGGSRSFPGTRTSSESCRAENRLRRTLKEVEMLVWFVSRFCIQNGKVDNV